jgi:hypothetical protein
MRKPTQVNPRTLLLFSTHKCGKTHLVSKLEDHLIVNFDDGADFYECNATDPLKNLNDLKKFYSELKELYTSNGKKPVFKYIVIDTITAFLDGPGKALAIKYYNLEQNKNYSSSFNIEGLPFGAGYQYIRLAVLNTIQELQKYCETLIVLAHSKTNVITTNGEELMIKDVDLPGRLKNQVGYTVDAIGLLYRKEDDENWVKFTHSDDLPAGNRAKHLRNRDILISKLENFGTKDEKLVTYWDEIFLP